MGAVGVLAGVVVPDAVGGDGLSAQAPSKASRKAAAARPRGRDNRSMWLILLEALGALLILGVIVWWTMFSGRRGGERSDDDTAGR